MTFEIESGIGQHGEWTVTHDDGLMWDKPIAELMLPIFCGQSVIDLGCGMGHYVRFFRAHGVEIDGVDGAPWVGRVTPGCRRVDLAQMVEWSRRYDWAMCLEVGEHVPAEFSRQFLDNVASAASRGVVLSWATPGQPGHGHCNCRDNQWVIEQMAARGWQIIPKLTHQFREEAHLPWFRRTLMVFGPAGVANPCA